MIPKRKLLLFFIQLLGVVSFLTAQENYRVVRWSSNEGLSAETNSVMLKDVNGFLWIGSVRGVDRFDGNKFKNYFPDKNKQGTIIGYQVNSLIEDSLHNIWMGTEKGLSRYDIKADTFRNFLPAVNSVNGEIIPFWATRDEVYCVETASSITAYNIHSFEKKILAGPSPEHTGAGRTIPAVFDARSNSVWLLEGAFAQPGGGLFQISLANGTTSHHTWSCYKNIPGHSHLSNDMCYDSKRNSIWISCADGLIEFTLNDKQFHPAAGLDEIANLNDFMSPGGVDVDLQDRVWWNSSPKGIIIYDPHTLSFTPVFSNPRRQQSSVFPCYHIYCDRDGMVWVSGWYAAVGIYQIIRASIPVFRYSDDTSQAHLLTGDYINNVMNADQGKLWIGQADKLTIFDPQTGFFQLFSTGRDLPGFKGMPITLSTPVQVDTVHQKALFTITNNQPGIELIQMDILTKQCRPVIFKDSAGQVMADPPVDYNIIPYKTDAILVSDNGDGIYMVNTKTGLAQWIAPGVKRSIGLGTDNDHLIFIRQAVTNLTYSLVNGKWKRIVSPLDSIAWLGGALYYNKEDKTYWAGDFNQLIHYDKDFRVIRRYTQSDGLSTEDITSILSNDQDNIWIQTTRSISKLNLTTGKFILLGEKDGLRKQSYGHHTAVEAGGDLYFWGDNSIDRVSPGKLAESYPPSFVYLKSLEINQKPFPLPTGINDLRELSLRYNDNQITIETGIIDYYSKGSNHIRYKLEEINGDWQIAPANYIIRYDGLPPGKYRLVMQASNAAGDFNGPEKILLIHINPPIWQTWWFKTILTLAIIGIIYGIYRYQLKQVLRLQNIRNRIAADLHDDIGSTLNSISVYSEVAKKDKEGKTQALEMIGESSRKVIDAMSDIVWTINPDNDSFERIILRMRSLSYNLLRARQIDFSFRADENLNNLKLSLEERRNFYLIFKEALNNLIKYSNAKRASVLLSRDANHITLQIRDDGTGFDTKKKYNGNGLINMQKRSKEINAELHIESGEGIGTSIQLKLNT